MPKAKYLTLLSLSFLFTINILSIYAQNSFATFGSARSIGMADANLAIKGIHGSFTNQAGLAFLEEFAVIVSAQNRFLLKETQLSSFGIALPTTSGTFGLNLHYFGFSDFNESKVGINYSRKLGKDLAIATQFDIFNTRILEYGTTTTPTFELGLIYRILQNIEVGVHLFNPIRSTLQAEEKLPTILQFGFTYTPSKFLSISLATEKDIETPFILKAGLEYLANEKFYLRVGIQSKGNLLNLGIGHQINRIQVNFAASYHAMLGFSPSIGVIFASK